MYVCMYACMYVCMYVCVSSTSHIYEHMYEVMCNHVFLDFESVCICQHQCYIVATCDKDLKRRIRKVSPFPAVIAYTYTRTDPSLFSHSDVCACAPRPAAAARVSPARSPWRATSPAFHAHGSASPFRTVCCHSQQIISSFITPSCDCVVCDCLSYVFVAQIPGVPIMYIQARRFTIERMPEAFGAPKV